MRESSATAVLIAVLIAVLGLVLAAAPARAAELFVLNDQRTVTVYPGEASGDVAPVRSLSALGPGARLTALAVDIAHGEILLADAEGAAVLVFPIGASLVSAPSRAIRGPATGLGRPVGLAYDPVRDEIYALNEEPPSVTVYPRTAAGDAPPLRTLAGPGTGIAKPSGLALDLVHGELVVSDTAAGTVLVHPRTADGDAAPVRVLAVDAATRVVGAVAVDALHGELLVVRGPGRELAVFPRTATGDAGHLRVLRSGTPEGWAGVAVDAARDELVLLDAGAGFPSRPAVLAYARTAADGDAPLRAITGVATALSDPRALALGGLPPEATTLVAAVLPSSRSVPVGTTASAFVSIANTGAVPAFAVGIAAAPFGAADVTYHPTRCDTNAFTGAPNEPVDIAPGGRACYAVFLTPAAIFEDPIDVAFDFGGVNTVPVPPLSGVNTLLLSGSARPTADVVAVAATAGQDGIVEVPGVGAAGAFAVAASNVGVSDTLAVSADTGAAALPLGAAVCQTDALGQCLAPPAPSVTTALAGAIDAGAPGTASFGVFVTATGGAAFDPAVTRVFLRFRDPGGTIRGATSVAVRIH